MTRVLAIALGALFLLVVLGGLYGYDQYGQVQQRESEALQQLAKLQAKQEALEDIIALRNDSLAAVADRARSAEMAADGYRRRVTLLLSALDQPTQAFNGTDSALAAAMAAHWRSR